MKPASFFAGELLNKYCIPIKDGTGVIEAFVSQVQEDASKTPEGYELVPIEITEKMIKASKVSWGDRYIYLPQWRAILIASKDEK